MATYNITTFALKKGTTSRSSSANKKKNRKRYKTSYIGIRGQYKNFEKICKDRGKVVANNFEIICNRLTFKINSGSKLILKKLPEIQTKFIQSSNICQDSWYSEIASFIVVSNIIGVNKILNFVPESDILYNPVLTSRGIFKPSRKTDYLLTLNNGQKIAVEVKRMHLSKKNPSELKWEPGCQIKCIYKADRYAGESNKYVKDEHKWDQHWLHIITQFQDTHHHVLKSQISQAGLKHFNRIIITRCQNDWVY